MTKELVIPLNSFIDNISEIRNRQPKFIATLRVHLVGQVPQPFHGPLAAAGSSLFKGL